MKYFFPFFLLVVLFSPELMCQNVSGHIQYGVKSSFYFDQDSLNLAQKMINQSTDKMKDLSFLLKFTNEESLYEFEDYLELKNSEMSKKMALDLTGKGVYYMNSKTKERLIFKDFLGDAFLVAYPFENLKWRISKNSKKIDKYTCYKATLDLKKDAMNTKDRTIEAWFTPQIPIGFGPKNYFGLPGLILELKEGKLVYYAKEISLSEKTEIQRPKKGKKITEEKFNEYVIDKSKEYGFIRE